LVVSAPGHNQDRHACTGGELSSARCRTTALARLNDDPGTLIDHSLSQHRELERPQAARHET
jgi:hypothetical protein